MSANTTGLPATAESVAVTGAGRRLRLPKHIAVVYVWIIIVVAFGLYRPELLFTSTTITQVLNNSAITGLAALSILIPLATKTFDLSIGFVMSLAGVTATYLIAELDVHVVLAVAAAIAVSLAVGGINAFVVVRLGVDSFIGTMATGSLIAALITFITNEQNVTSQKLSGPFAKLGQTNFGGLNIKVIYFVVVAAALWFLFQKTVLGRKLYAVGFNKDAAVLSGVPADRYRALALVTSAGLAGCAGVALASTLGSGSISAGTSYLLPAFAAAFLGSTQLHPGRFNSVGTVLSVLMLTTGTTALALSLAPKWSSDMLTGVVLITALALTGTDKARNRWRSRRASDVDLTPPATAATPAASVPTPAASASPQPVSKG